MNKTFLRVLVSCLMLLPVAGQTQVDLRKQSKAADLSAIGPTKPFETGAALPATCTQGQTYFLTTATPGSNLYGCTALNIWNVLGAGAGGAGVVGVQVDGVITGAQDVLNLITSPGLELAVVDDGMKLNITPNVRSSYFLTRENAQGGSDSYCVSSSGSSTIYTCVEPGTLAAYTDGMRILWKPDMACTGGGAITLDIDGLGAKDVYQSDGVTRPAGIQCVAGSQVLLAYSSVLNSGQGGWRILNGTTVLPPMARTLSYSFDGNGAALTSGRIGYLADVPFACTLSSWALAADTGTATVDVWMASDGTSVPEVSDSITAMATPEIATGTRIRSTALTGWTVLVPVHSVLAFQLSAVSAATVVNLTMECDQ